MRLADSSMTCGASGLVFPARFRFDSSMARTLLLSLSLLGLLIPASLPAQLQPSEKQLANWLKRFPDADADKDGILTVEEAKAYRDKLPGRGNSGKGKGKSRRSGGQGAPRTFPVDPGWNDGGVPEHSLSRKTPAEIRAVYAEQVGGGKAVTSFEKPENGALRIVGTGHSFMSPGYRTFPRICEGAGWAQPLYTHIGGGITGSARYKWEQENGIFEFDGEPVPKLLSSIANAEWDAMMWGPYFSDRPEYYTVWIDFCRRFHPDMKFYLSDAWPQLYQLGEIPESEDFFTDEVFDRIGTEKHELYAGLIREIRERTVEDVYILPTSDAMTLAAKAQIRGELPGIEGVHQVVGKRERSLWRDELGHLGPGFDRLEGYVFFATIYGRSPEKIGESIPFGEADFPSPELDRIFRRIAWKAVTGHPLSGVRDEDGDGLADPEEAAAE